MNLPTEQSSQQWDHLVAQVDRYIEAWETAGEPPADLTAFLPDEPADLRQLVLIELVKVDLEYRHSQNISPLRIEDYLQRYPELGEPDGISCDLIYEEFHVRQPGEPDLAVDEYYQRFPDQKEALQRLLGKETVLGSTQLCGQKTAIRPLHPGETIDDFDLLLQLGAGSFGTVFLARQQSMQRLVALKVTGKATQEPQTLAQLEHPHIVRVYDQRVIEDEPMRLLYMQFVPGGTLADVIKQTSSLPYQERSGQTLLKTIDQSVEQAGQSPLDHSAAKGITANSSWHSVVCQLGIQLAQALDYAHQRGVFHRDIKPANILMSAAGDALLADFNVSFDSRLEGASPATFFGGSLAYMSPEQLEACNPTLSRGPEEVEGRSDLFALGIVLWELLLGEHPFRDDRLAGSWLTTLKEMAHRRKTQSPQPPASMTGKSPVAPLIRVLSKCLVPDPADRFQTGQELVEALELCLRPRASSLLLVPEKGWQQLVRRQPVPALLLAILGPNALAALVNLIYNQQEIISRVPEHATAFYHTVLLINGIVFPFIILFGYFASSRLRRRLQLDLKSAGPDKDNSQPIRRRVLNAGNHAVIIGIVIWLSAGILFPLIMQLNAGTLPGTVYLHFVISMLLCGAIAAVYPFFFVSFIALRAFYPLLLAGNPPSASDCQQLTRISQQASRYLLIAGGVPLVGVTLLAFNQSTSVLAHSVLSVSGLIGFMIAFRMHRLLQLDIAALTGSHN
jgi:serine/threonine protein kinase